MIRLWFDNQPRKGVEKSFQRNSTMPKDKVDIQWLGEPEDHNYPAALSYLSLLFAETTATTYVEKLRHAPATQFKAKDIFRASGLSLLGVSNSHVENDQRKIAAGKKLSPLLLVRDSTNSKVIIADGYHRLCAVTRMMKMLSSLAKSSRVSVDGKGRGEPQQGKAPGSERCRLNHKARITYNWPPCDTLPVAPPARW